jgi:hypothetical protein
MTRGVAFVDDRRGVALTEPLAVAGRRRCFAVSPLRNEERLRLLFWLMDVSARPTDRLRARQSHIDFVDILIFDHTSTRWSKPFFGTKQIQLRGREERLWVIIVTLLV